MRLSNELTPDRRHRQSKHPLIISRPITGHIMVHLVARQVIDRIQVKLIRPIIRPAVRAVIRAKPVPKLSLKAVLRTRKPKISPVLPTQQRILNGSLQLIQQIHRQIKIITHSPAIARSITDRPTPPSPPNRRLHQRLNQHSSPRPPLKALSQSRLAIPHLVNRQALANGLVPHQKFLKLLLKRLHHRFLIHRPLADRVWI